MPFAVFGVVLILKLPDPSPFNCFHDAQLWVFRMALRRVGYPSDQRGHAFCSQWGTKLLLLPCPSQSFPDLGCVEFQNIQDLGRTNIVRFAGLTDTFLPTDAYTYSYLVFFMAWLESTLYGHVFCSQWDGKTLWQRHRSLACPSPRLRRTPYPPNLARNSSLASVINGDLFLPSLGLHWSWSVTRSSVAVAHFNLVRVENLVQTSHHCKSRVDSMERRQWHLRVVCGTQNQWLKI